MAMAMAMHAVVLHSHGKEYKRIHMENVLANSSSTPTILISKQASYSPSISTTQATFRFRSVTVPWKSTKFERIGKGRVEEVRIVFFLTTYIKREALSFSSGGGCLFGVTTNGGIPPGVQWLLSIEIENIDERNELLEDSETL